MFGDQSWMNRIFNFMKHHPEFTPYFRFAPLKKLELNFEGSPKNIFDEILFMIVNNTLQVNINKFKLYLHLKEYLYKNFNLLSVNQYLPNFGYLSGCLIKKVNILIFKMKQNIKIPYKLTFEQYIVFKINKLECISELFDCIIRIKYSSDWSTYPFTGQYSNIINRIYGESDKNSFKYFTSRFIDHEVAHSFMHSILNNFILI